MIVFSDLYSPSNLMVATLKNSYVLLHSSVWEDAQYDQLIAFDALKMAFRYRGVRLSRGGNCDTDQCLFAAYLRYRLSKPKRNVEICKSGFRSQVAKLC